jgi:hypothetical protein
LKISPARGARSPSIKNVLREFGCALCIFTELAQPAAILSETGNPFSAYQIAGARSSANGLVPNRSRIACHPAATPGTVTE